MSLLIVGPKLIPTDEMIYLGTKNLLNQVNWTEDEYIVINDHALEEIKPKTTPTHIIVMGTPWVWDRCWESFKWKNLENVFSAYPTAKRLFLGVGSCFPLHKGKVILESLASNSLSLFQGSTVIVRDHLAAKALIKYDPIYLKCPATFAIHDRCLGVSDWSSKAKRAAVWYDPTLGISKADFYEGSQALEEYLHEFRKELMSPWDVELYCILPEEIPMAERLGFGTPTVLKSAAEAIEALDQCYSILSGRVHMAVPFIHSVRNVTLVPVDSREFAFTKAASRDWDFSLSSYKSILNLFKNP